MTTSSPTLICRLCDGPMTYKRGESFVLTEEAASHLPEFAAGDEVLMHSWHCDEAIRDRVHLRTTRLASPDADISGWVAWEQQWIDNEQESHIP